VCREKKLGFFARMKKRGAKGDGDETSRGGDAKQMDPAGFPDVKSRRSTLPPLQDEQPQADEEDRRRRRRSRNVEEDSDEVERHKMSSLRDLPPLYPSVEQQQQERRASRRRSDYRQHPPTVHEDGEDDF